MGAADPFFKKVYENRNLFRMYSYNIVKTQKERGSSKDLKKFKKFLKNSILYQQK